MKIAPAALVAATFALVFAACGKGGSSASVKGSCNFSAKGFCNDFTGSQYTQAQVQSACKAQGVTFSGGACPDAGRVGSCLVYAGAPTESHYRYYAAFPGGKAAAEQQCKGLLKGTWTSP